MSFYCPAVETASQDPRHQWVDTITGKEETAEAYIESVCERCGAVRVFVRREAWDAVKAAIESMDATLVARRSRW